MPFMKDDGMDIIELLNRCKLNIREEFIKHEHEVPDAAVTTVEEMGCSNGVEVGNMRSHSL